MSTEEKSLNFIEQIIEEDLKNGLSQDKLRFRFPPEPNGYLHVGHASAICLNFGLGIDYQAPVNLRFDDTNRQRKNRNLLTQLKKMYNGLVINGIQNVMHLIIFNNYTIGLLNLLKKEKPMLTVNRQKKWLFKKVRQQLQELIHHSEIDRLKRI